MTSYVVVFVVVVVVVWKKIRVFNSLLRVDGGHEAAVYQVHNGTNTNQTTGF